jgi:Type III restriction enzyme, res subunit
MGISNKLILFDYLLREFGFEDFKQLQGKFSDEELRYDVSEKSAFYTAMLGKGRVSDADLKYYDDNIIGHLQKINAKRQPKISLKYYQYMSLLFTERYLDLYFKDKQDFAGRLTQFVNDLYLNIHRNPRYQFLYNTIRDKENGDRKHIEDFRFAEDDLNLIAYWQATGSGKTFTLHFNILQYRHYCKNVRNLILLTPTESLSKQHLEELGWSGIEADSYPNRKDESKVVKVIDIHKIKEFTSGKGVTVKVSEFGQGNAIFVDEGHKGIKDDGVWRDMRKKMGADGFTFEYSATFGQIGEGMHAYYGKSIVFDYSYKYFYKDGYGKNYRIRNLSEEQKGLLKDVTAQQSYLLGNILVFTQQKLYYKNHFEALQPYRIENPLLIFVGHTVNPSDKSKVDKDDDYKGLTANEAVTSDVKLLLQFFSDVLEKPEKYKTLIAEILRGGGQFQNEFTDDLDYLKGITKDDGEMAYTLLLQEVFHAKAPDKLELKALRKGNGEIGLIVKNTENYFGLINIGDVSTFKSSLSGTPLELGEADIMTDGLFDTLSSNISKPVNILIGARKFIEGWNNYRVSGIGLINFGKSEGSQIIQLFGRGVRLKGRNFSLKRSKRGEGIDDFMPLVETLNVFGLNAKYMENFRKDLEKEGINIDLKEITVPVQLWQHQGKTIDDLGLKILKRKNANDFNTTEVFALDYRNDIKINVDLRTKMLSYSGQNNANAADTEGVAWDIKAWKNWIDWSDVFLNIGEFKQQKQMTNLSISPATLPQLFEQIDLTIVADNDLSIKQATDAQRLQRVTSSALRQYVEHFYNRKKRIYEGNNLETAVLKTDNPVLQNLDYTLQIRMVDAEGKPIDNINKRLSEIEAVLEKVKADITQYDKNTVLLNAWFDNHAYQPLLIDAAEQDKRYAIEAISPKGLNKGEAKFVKDLQDFIKRKGNLYDNYEFYLLRNATKSKGFGFYFDSSGGFFPDFLLWIKAPDGKQYLTFIDPHGLRNEDNGFESDKIQLSETIKKLPVNTEGIILNSFILSPTSYKEANLKARFNCSKMTDSEFVVKCKTHNVFDMIIGNEYFAEIVGKIIS